MVVKKHCAVFGYPIAHSLSPSIHQQFAEQCGVVLEYSKQLVNEAVFEEKVNVFFQQGGLGLNITLPFKERAYVMADCRTERCQQAGAANTLWMKNGLLHADNTDGIGFIRDIRRYLDLSEQSILILGAGGAARGVIGPLLACRPKLLTVANRTLERADALRDMFIGIETCELAKLAGGYDLVINATSAGLKGQALPFADDLVASKPFCYDLSYQADSDTPFVHWAKQHGLQVVDGIGMLIEQAAESFYIWHGKYPDTSKILTK